MKHAHDNSSPIERALASIPPGTPLYMAARIGEDRDLDYERAASALYEELRTLTREQLAERAGHDGSKQVLVAEIIQAELGGHHED